MDGSQIRELRLARGLTQKEFAEMIGTSQHLVNRWERGVHKASLESIEKIARATGRTVEVRLVDVP